MKHMPPSIMNGGEEKNFRSVSWHNGLKIVLKISLFLNPIPLAYFVLWNHLQYNIVVRDRYGVDAEKEEEDSSSSESEDEDAEVLINQLKIYLWCLQDFDYYSRRCFTVDIYILLWV